MSVRELEEALLIRCVAVARDEAALAAQDQREANVFQLAATLLQTQFQRESVRLMRSGALYFLAFPDARLTAAQVLRRGWVVSLPRLRDMLTQHLQGTRHG